MIIAERLRNTNRAEYLLYMWQVEDLLRACDCDIDTLDQRYLAQFQLSPEQRESTVCWYADLCRMMVEEGLRTGGHLQINKNALQDLAEMHTRLLSSTKFPYYREMYYRVLPHIVEVRAKGADKEKGEIETCLDVLYGILLLRMQQREVSAETTLAAKEISNLLGQLSDYYLKDRQEPLDL